MDHSLISVRYAKALFSLSQDKDIVERVYNDMQILMDQCSKTKAFNDLLKSPVVTPFEKKKAFNSIFAKYIHQITMQFLQVIIDNKREELLEDIGRNYIDFYKNQIGLKTATLYTAFPLTEDYIANVKDLLEKELKTKIELNVSIREHLIGGFILMVDGKMMDASIFNKLKKLKNKLLS